MKRSVLLFLALIVGRMVFGAYLENIPQTIQQPDGRIIHCFGSGDEYYHWLHDANGYTIVVNPADGFFYYGIRQGENVVPSRFIAGEVDPAKVGLEKGAKISLRLYTERKAEFTRQLKATNGTPTKGLVNSLCIYISFADDSVFSHDRAYFRDQWESPDHPSVKDYFHATSYEQLDLEISHFPASPDTVNLCYKDIHPRNYYLPQTAGNPDGYSSDRAAREHGMLKRAVEYVSSQVPDSLVVDMNDDGIVDNICFIIQGTNSAWSDLLWPHAWGLFTYDVRLQGAKVNSYFLTLETSATPATMCHELGHVFGAPDLYHYSDSGKTGPDAVGGWCLMCSNGNPPQSICGFLKYKYNHWISDLPEITESGQYFLRPLTEPTHNLYKVKSPYSRSEYFVLEYRKKEGRYESSAPGTGLVVYRINPGAGNGNAGGPPDEVYVYRPGGNFVDVGALSSAALLAPNRTAINDKTDPDCFLWNNGQGGPGGLDLFNVSEAGDSITFEVNINHLFPPTNLTFNPGTGIVDLSWKPSMVDGLTGYTIYRDGVLYGSSTGPSFRDSEVVENQTYTYYVTASYSGNYTGESEPSNTITYTPKAIQNLPYSETFETIGHGWKIKGNVEGFQWGDNISLNMNTDNHTHFLGANSVMAGNNTWVTDYAVTPRLNLLNKNLVYAHFDYTLKRWQQLDHLKVYFRRNPAESWYLIIDMPVSPVSGLFRWKKYNLEIPSDAYSGEAQLGFQYDDSKGLGYGAGIDNVVVDEMETSGIDDNSDPQTVTVYPNPAGDETTLEITGSAGAERNLRLISPDGKVLWSKVRPAGTQGPESINLKGIAAGLYYVVVETDSEVTIKPVVKQN